MTLNQTLLEDLWNGEKSVGFFVFLGHCFWILDERYNFCLDAEKDYRAYLEKGHISQDQFSLACKEFRGGVIKLTADNFPQYLDNSKDKILSLGDFEKLFVKGSAEIFKKVESFFLTGEALSTSELKYANELASWLPKFYINFDRKIYMHMDFGRLHEELSYPDWISKCADFSFLIPDKERYWSVDGNDFWKLKYI